MEAHIKLTLIETKNGDQLRNQLPGLTVWSYWPAGLLAGLAEVACWQALAAILEAKPRYNDVNTGIYTTCEH